MMKVLVRRDQQEEEGLSPPACSIPITISINISL